MSSVLNGSSALQHFEGGNVVKIRNRMMFDSYTGLPLFLTVYKYALLNFMKLNFSLTIHGNHVTNRVTLSACGLMKTIPKIFENWKQ